MIKKEFLRDIMASALHSHARGVVYLNFAILFATFIFTFGIDQVSIANSFQDLIPSYILLTGSSLCFVIIIIGFMKSQTGQGEFNPFFFKSVVSKSVDEIEKELLSITRSPKKIIRAYSYQLSKLSKVNVRQFQRIKALFLILGISVLGFIFTLFLF